MADAAHAQRFNVPAGRLGDVAAALGAQAGITIAVTDPDLAARRSPGIRGASSVRAALAQALRGTGAEAMFYDKATVRIVRRRAPPPPPTRPKPAPAPAPPPAEHHPAEIVVTASKQGMLLDNYPGSVKFVELEPGWLARNAAAGTAAITEALPTLGSTNLGPGRDKLFVRGIADSSFNGPTQATVGQYLGDVRLNYNAPDPDLNLYDMQRVEVLVGPQGTLYGASSLGGIIRLVPNAPDGSAAYATASGGVSSTRFGAIGSDAAAMFNLPVGKGGAAVRLVLYGAREAGYIDDPSRALRDINSTRSYGTRMTLRLPDLSGWTIDLGGVFQNIASRDGQYTLRGDPPLTRTNALQQPFHNDYRVAYLNARRMLGSSELVTTTSVVRHELRSIFDATGHDGSATPTQFEEENDITLVSHETRVSGGSRKTPWVAGVAGIYNDSQLRRSLGPPASPAQIAGVRNRQLELSLFGQASHPLGRSLIATAGGRLTFARSTGRLLDESRDADEGLFRNQLRFSPSFALDWHVTRSLSGFLHFQQGYRAGGLAVAPSGSTLESQKFAADDLGQIELGVRWGHKERDRLSVRAAMFLVDWNHIQADLVDSSGLPYTANIGSGRIYGLDGEITWRLSPAVTVTAAAFLNNSYLRAAEPAFAGEDQNTLPNIAHTGVRVAAEWRTQIAAGISLTGNASLRHVGKSNLGAGPLLGVSQGDYTVAGLGGRLDFGGFGISLDVANLGDTRANTFAFGNPFSLRDGDQMTPLRPRTIRLGIDARF
ncbi:TonB-dependent receptor domain-containing protein [Sphingomonas sp. DT-204]|uniref:TonB-dependent receptor domain-containing protein n=1 Tax=Sphingomonas sp. DT-204 TaxID=3396166 RepID=UPI003F1B1A7F